MQYSEDPDFRRAMQTFRDASAEARRYGNEMVEALEKASFVNSQTDQELYKRKAESAAQAYSNFLQAAELAREVCQEIAAGIPRRRR